MTKTKSKKMTKSTFAIIIMAVVMVAMLAFGGTYAYFTATATKKTGEVTTGHVKLSADGATFTGIQTNVLPGDALFSDDATLTIDTTDDAGNYVAIKFTITGGENLSIAADGIEPAGGTGTGWYETSTAGIFIYGIDAETASAITAGSVEVPLTNLVIPTSVDDDWVEGEDTSTGNLMDATITVTMEAKSIQVSNLSAADAVTELIAAFSA